MFVSSPACEPDVEAKSIVQFELLAMGFLK